METQIGSGEWESATVATVLSGDTEAFGAIVSAYEARLRSFCRARLPESEVDDAMQDVFIKIFRSLKTYKPRYRFSVWFFSVAHSSIAGRKYRFKRELEKMNRIIAFRVEPPPRNDGQERLEAEMVRLLVSRLGRGNRRVVELYYFAELGIAEIAELLSVSETAIKARLFRSRKELFALMEKSNRGRG